MKIFLVLTQALAMHAFKEAGAGGIPMLNDNLGDRCHLYLEDAIAASVEISESLEVREPLAAVVHIEFSDDLHKQLVYKNLMRRDTEKDVFGKELWKLSPAACATINRVATMSVSFHKLDLLIRKERPVSELLN